MDDRLALDPRWLAVQHLIASKSFTRSPRLISFLSYVCRCTLEDRRDEITEQQIGIHVFDRPASYNPGDDNIVRTTARQLRQRLALYYLEEGAADALRVDIPRGAYHPRFLPRHPHIQPGAPVETVQVDAEEAASEPSGARVETGKPESLRARLRALAWPVLAAMLAGCILTLFAERLILARRSGYDAGWQPWPALLSTNVPTVFVAGDAGLNMYNNLARTQVTLGDYASSRYLGTPAAQVPAGYTWGSLAGRRYVSYVDLQFATRLQTFAAHDRVPFTVRFARDVTAEDLRNRNLVLTGSAMYNPWIALFDNGLNFHLEYDGARNEVSVRNRRPAAGEPARYLAEPGDLGGRGLSHGFGYLALCDNLEGNGKVLLIEGSTVAGVDAAVSFLTNQARMAPILQQAARRQGRFEVLLSASFLKSSSPDATLLATRF